MQQPNACTCERSAARCTQEPCVVQVYKGRRRATGQITAMKFIVKHGKSTKDIRNLRQEIEILRNLKHENIIQMLDTFETNDSFCVVTEFAQGAYCAGLLSAAAGSANQQHAPVQPRCGACFRMPADAVHACIESVRVASMHSARPQWAQYRRALQQHQQQLQSNSNFDFGNRMLVAGELFEVLEDDKSLPENQVQNIAKQLVRALNYLHHNNIIHRDMKPQNILLGAQHPVLLTPLRRSLSQACTEPSLEHEQSSERKPGCARAHVRTCRAACRQWRHHQAL